MANFALFKKRMPVNQGDNYYQLSNSGQILTLEDTPEDLFTVHSEVKELGTALWPYCALTFLLLLIADVTVRKILRLNEIIQET